MEATEQTIVGRDSDGGLSEASKKVLECLIRHKADRHMTVERIAAEIGHDRRGVGPALGSLKRRGMVVERHDESTGRSFFRVSDPELVGYPLACKAPGCAFVAKSRTGLAIHSGRVHKAPQMDVVALEEDHDDEEDEEDEVPVTDVPQSSDDFERARQVYLDARKAGWSVQVIIRLSLETAPRLGAS